MLCASSSSLNDANSSPVTALLSSVKIPILRAIDFAVIRLSPVIITVLIPAALQAAISSVTLSLGGSIIPSNPTKVSPCSISSGFGFAGILSSGRIAMQTILKASSAIASLIFNTSSAFMPTHSDRTTSGAPLIIANGFSFIMEITVMVLRSESNGITPIRGKKPAISFSDIEL